MLGLAAVGWGWQLLPASSPLRDGTFWLHAVQPGELSHAHAALESDCGACHTSVAGVEDSKCIACHATEERLLTWPETIFHASIQQCAACHLEHRGRSAEMRVMDHALLASMAIGALERDAPEEANPTVSHLAAMLAERRGRPEAAELLRCAGCHARKDVHQELFGSQCGTCHETTRWTIPAYQHPSGRSEDCAQCHRAPPDHSGGHFEKMGRSDVRQCAMCHQPPSWSDIAHPPWFDHEHSKEHGGPG